MKKKQQRDRGDAIKSYLKGESVTAIAQKLGYSRAWVYKWIERYQASGEADHWQEDQTRCPHSNPRQLPVAVVEAVKLKDEGARRGGSGEGGGNSIAQAFENLGEYPRRWRSFLHEVRVEMRQVTWPTRRETAVTTAMVFVMVALASVFFLVADQIMRFLVTLVLGGDVVLARTLVLFNCACMLGAGVVLFVSAGRQMVRAAVMQAAFPVLAWGSWLVTI